MQCARVTELFILCGDPCNPNANRFLSNNHLQRLTFLEVILILIVTFSWVEAMGNHWVIDGGVEGVTWYDYGASVVVEVAIECDFDALVVVVVTCLGYDAGAEANGNEFY